jgi:adenylate cyclase
MPNEIERKFLVTGDGWRAGKSTRYTQGYLSRDKGRTVRVRLGGDKAFITIKGESTNVTRQEFEYPIPAADADSLFKLCLGPLIEKTRTVIEHEGKKWEVDEFHGDNEGLIMAEIELENEDEPFARPPWLGEEVSHDRRYYNSQLSQHPYKEWKDAQ